MTRSRLRVIFALPLLMLAILFSGTAAAHADTPRPDRAGVIYFHSPSGTFHCAVFPAESWPFQAGCQGYTTPTNAGERACLTRWGPNGMSMLLNRDGAHAALARFGCQNQGVFVGGTTATGRSGPITRPILGYGRSVHAGYITCTMSTTGVTCLSDRTRHGFTISRQTHRTF